ncbi:CoA transferase [Peribacillus frigoritolerans]|nr:CoA transferase [Peribacillus frigoritolerans]
MEASLLDSVVSLSNYLGQNVLATGQAPERFGSAHPSLVPYQAFETKDGYVTIAVTNDRLWRKNVRCA